ncbi:hypothetical protein CRG98_041291 [Punica granatum]|uniref:Uncharacterized protein n=1 Tax=Punica granatum TaxID=22663 RepID=A0A2I0I2V2_PUNGR|nr:hypothetical protein CRG98_041291 [Punica granatum]
MENKKYLYLCVIFSLIHNLRTVCASSLSWVAGVVALEVLLRAAVAAAVVAAVAVAAVPTYLYVGSLSWVDTVVALDVLLPAAAVAVAVVLEMIGFGQG